MTLLEELQSWLEKASKAGYHDHDGTIQEHPVRVKDHEAYFSNSKKDVKPEIHDSVIDRARSLRQRMPDFDLRQSRLVRTVAKHLPNTHIQTVKSIELVMESFLPNFPPESQTVGSHNKRRIQLALKANALTLIHEVGHAVQWDLYDRNTKVGLNLVLESFTFFDEAQKKNKFISDYSRTNGREFFAEVYTEYLVNPKFVKKFNPKLKEFFDRVSKAMDSRYSKRLRKEDEEPRDPRLAEMEEPIADTIEAGQAAGRDLPEEEKESIGSQIKDSDLQKAVGPAEIASAKQRGLVPQSGSWNQPGRWVSPKDQRAKQEHNPHRDKFLRMIRPGKTLEDHFGDYAQIQVSKDGRLFQVVSKQDGEILSSSDNLLREAMVYQEENEWHDVVLKESVKPGMAIHVTPEPILGDELYPDIPGAHEYGNYSGLFEYGIPRVSFSPSVMQSLEAAFVEDVPDYGEEPDELYVYTNADIVDMLQPTHALVSDVDDTLELNTFKPTKVRLVGKIKFQSGRDGELRYNWIKEIQKQLQFITKEAEGLEIQKAVIPTPKNKETGKVDLGQVPSGSSVWITVTNPESPLHGRPMLVTKRPDGLMAVTGGAGQDIDARRHMVLTGTPKQSKRDKKVEAEIEEAHNHNDPIIAARKEFAEEARRESRAAADQMMAALGITKPNKNQLLQQKDEIQNYVAETMDLDSASDEAKRITDVIIRQVVATHRKVAEGVQRKMGVVFSNPKIGKRLTALRDEVSDETAEDIINDVQNAIPDYDSFTVNLPDLESLQDLTPIQQEAVVANYFDKQADIFFEGDRNDHTPDSGEKAPQIEIGTNIKPLELRSQDDLEKAVNSVRNYWQKKRQAETHGGDLHKVSPSPISPSTMTELRGEIRAAGPDVDISDDEIERRANENYYNWMRNNSAMAFYDAVGTFWNDDTSLSDALKEGEVERKDSTMKFNVESGAATAFAALAKEHLGLRMDTMKLIQNGNIELAAAMIAKEILDQPGQTKQSYDRVLQSVRDFNAQNQKATEDRALSRHFNLDRQYQEIQRQKGTGELLDETRIDELEMQSLMEQRKNLGNALGSLQASATFYDYLEKFKAGGQDMVRVNIGRDLSDAQALRERLRLSDRNSAIDESDPENITVKVALPSLGKLVTQEADIQAKNDRYEKIKTDMSGVSEDSRGNLVVDNFAVPYWRDHFENEAGETQEYKWRVEQRNDINWLQETTRRSEDNPLGQGGGLITRVVGAGKTNTALGFFAYKLEENPNYKAIIAVPRGRSQQWVDEARKFSSLPIEHIPDGMAKAQVDDILLESKPGTIFVTGHREASRSHEVLTALQTNSELKGKFHGITIDEPQDMIAGTSGNVGAMAKRLMKLPFDHRLGLTATPAKNKPVEAYDMVRWASGTKELGSRASFDRSFKGFGSGVNAQDQATTKALFDTIRPYISGERITALDFKIDQNNIDIKRTPQQIRRQKEIERNSEKYIQNTTKRIINEVRANPNHRLRRGKNWQSKLSANAKKQARKDVNELHTKNMHGGDWQSNSKLLALKESLDSSPNKKHVIYIDSQAQRASLQKMLEDMGYSRGQIKNIAASATKITGRQMSDRVQAFKEGKVPIMMIDKASSSGYNLNNGDALHVIGNVPDATTYLQAQGRVARMPRTGDVTINTYRNSDNVGEQALWDQLDAQIKLLRAVSPGMLSD